LIAVGDPGARAFVGRLIDGALFADAVRFLAHALPKREAVWWAWVCARTAAGATPTTSITTALVATEQWIVQPTEDNRRAAMAAAEAAQLGTPAGCAALAAFLSAGSVGPANVAPVAAGEFASAKAVGGAVTLAAVADPPGATERFREYIGLGLQVADRARLWGE
jgi:hypothetical protein